MLICFTQPIYHDGDLLHLAPPTHLRPPLPQGLSIGTFNIRNGQGFGITQAIWEIQIGGFNLIILMETNITDQAYFHNRLGYEMVCSPKIMADAGGDQGGGGPGSPVPTKGMDP